MSAADWRMGRSRSARGAPYIFEAPHLPPRPSLRRLRSVGPVPERRPFLDVASRLPVRLRQFAKRL